MDFEPIRLQLESYEEPLKLLSEALQINSLSDRISEMEARAQEPDFWSDVENAQRIQTQIRRLQKKIENYNFLISQRQDLLVLCELGAEAEDAQVYDEVSEAFTEYQKRFEVTRLETLLTGEYDKNNAILTLHAGAGGTEAQDWVEMLYRMYCKWAEPHDFEVKELEYLDGDEAGI